MSEALKLLELSSLRSEVNAVIDRMNSNENFCAGTVSAILAFVLSTPNQPSRWAIAAAAAVVLAVCVRRYVELRAHARKLDAYMRRLELELAPGVGGWTEHYYLSIAGSRTGGYSATRWAFWLALAVVVIVTAALTLFTTTAAVP